MKRLPSVGLEVYLVAHGIEGLLESGPPQTGTPGLLPKESFLVDLPTFEIVYLGPLNPSSYDKHNYSIRA